MQNTKKKICIALEGGGTHGAIIWGVLDKLLQEDYIEISGISGTSAGAINGALVIDGIAKGGREAARKNLNDFWKALSKASLFSPLQRNFWDRLVGNWGMDHSPVYLFMDSLTRALSPYELNPMDLNPLLKLLQEFINFERVNNYTDTKLYVNATSVCDGIAKVFKQPGICAKSIMASAATPMLYQAVEIDGKFYWDGSFMGSPTLYPLIRNSRDTNDIVLVQVNPFTRSEVPKTSRDILNRMNEITYNTALTKELRSVLLLNQITNSKKSENKKSEEMLIHAIYTGDDLKDFSPSAKYNAEWNYLSYLRDLGRQSCTSWLEKNWDKIGTESTIDSRFLSRCNIDDDY